MKKGDIAYDQSKRAEHVLAHVLEGEINKSADLDQAIGKSVRSVPVELERKAAPVLDDRTSSRTMSRMLFITQDTNYLDPNSIEMNSMYKLSILFDEVHLMVLLSLRGQQETKRMADNFWLYRAEAQYWWDLPDAALAQANDQLDFSDGFRPDFIVATDPLEAGQAAKMIAEMYGRQFQIHVKDDFLNADFLRSFTFMTRVAKRRMAKRVLMSADSVRASTNQIRDHLLKKYKKLKNILLLPQHHSYKSIMQAAPSFDVHKQYAAGFTKVIAAFGPFSADSHLNDTISALRPVLLENSDVGLLLIGDGKGKDFLQKKVQKLGLKEKVLFFPAHIDTISVLKTVDMVIVTDTSVESERHVLSVAAAGAPMVLFETDFRLDLFTEGRSVSFCKPGEIHKMSGAAQALLSNQPLRAQYKEAAQYVVESRVEEDALKYFVSLRDSLELTLVGDSAEAGEGKNEKDNKPEVDEKN